MRNLLILLILLALVLAAVVGGGFLGKHPAGSAKRPIITEEGTAAKGAPQPTFDVETGSVAVGSESDAVTIPRLEVDAEPESDREDPAEEPELPAGA